MQLRTLIASTAVAVLNRGPATLPALRNGLAWGPRRALGSTPGDICGLFGRARALPARPRSSRWPARAAGTLVIGSGAALPTLRPQAA